MEDLRDWLKEIDRIGQLKRIEGADWDLEIGCLTALNARKRGPVLLFDNIKGYPKGYRVVASLNTNAATLGPTFNLPSNYSDSQLIQVLREKIPKWEASLDKFTPEVVKSGPILENVDSGDNIDLFKFPTPRWHKLDGGRYIGTGDAVITQDPDSGWVNLGTYRIMVHDKKTTGFHIDPGHHGRLHYEKYHARGQACPVAICIGHHPLVTRIASTNLPFGAEYPFIGAVRGRPIKVIKEEVTGLPIPADSEIVIAGWCPPGKTRPEGPFGEFTGYYAGGVRPIPILEVERVYYRNDPIIVGAPPNRTPSDSSYFVSILRSAQLHNELAKNGIPEIRGVWIGEMGGMSLVILSIKQMYAGHAKRAALLASQLSAGGAYVGRYVIVVDEDIDPTNTHEVLWAVCTRSDPEKDIDIIRRCWSSPLDPTIRKPAEAYFNSRAIIDACKPFEWINDFAKSIEIEPELAAQVRAKWGGSLAL